MSSQLLDTPSKHTTSISGLLDQGLNYAREKLFQTAWSPVSKLAESAVVALMQNMTKGRLRVLTFKHIYVFPSSENANDSEDDPALRAELRVVDDAFWIRLCTMGDLGFAEAYMYGEVECDDLVTTFLMFVYNRSNLTELENGLSFLFTIPQKITSMRFFNSIGNSRSNISAHYDISNRMFAGFLSEDMTYSCAIFKDLDGDLKDTDLSYRGSWSGGQGLTRVKALENGVPHIPSSNPVISQNPKDEELYEAQMRKIDHIIEQARIKPGQRVLEIGSGWGSLALRIATTIPGSTVDTITLSVHQQTFAQERMHDAGGDIASRVRVHLMDYRNMPKEWEGAFDRIVSIEMIEAVGQEFLETCWKTVDWAMKKGDGVGVVQVITIPEPRFDRYIKEIDFIRKWVSMPTIFPGGFLPTLTLLLQTLCDGSQGRLVVDSVSNIGPHYARTLREWRRRFIARFDDVIVPALKEEHPDVMNGPHGAKEIEVFKRKWIYYYCYCEVGFTTRTLGNHIVTFTREGNETFGCDIFN